MDVEMKDEITHLTSIGVPAPGDESIPGGRSFGMELAAQSASEPPAHHMSSALPVGV